MISDDRPLHVSGGAWGFVDCWKHPHNAPTPYDLNAMLRKRPASLTVVFSEGVSTHVPDGLAHGSIQFLRRKG